MSRLSLPLSLLLLAVLCALATLMGTARGDYNRIAAPPSYEQERIRLDLDHGKTGRRYRENEIEIDRQRETGEVKRRELPGQTVDSLRSIEGRSEIVRSHMSQESFSDWARRNWKVLLALFVVLGGAALVLLRR